jgi:hypothetical protein
MKRGRTSREWVLTCARGGVFPPLTGRHTRTESDGRGEIMAGIARVVAGINRVQPVVGRTFAIVAGHVTTVTIHNYRKLHII